MVSGALALSLAHSAKGASNTAYLFQTGDKDEAIPWKQSELMSDALRAKGNKSQVHIVSGTNHCFQGATKDQAKEVLDVYFRFLDDSLSKPAKK